MRQHSSCHTSGADSLTRLTRMSFRNSGYWRGLIGIRLAAGSRGISLERRPRTSWQSSLSTAEQLAHRLSEQEEHTRVHARAISSRRLRSISRPRLSECVEVRIHRWSRHE